MTFSYDFSDSSELGDFVTLTPGRYIFALASVKKDTSKSGNPKAVVTLRVVAGNPAYVDGVISQHWPVSGKGAFRFKAMLKALGVKVGEKGKVALEKYIDGEFGASVSLTPGDELTDDGETFYFHELSRIANVKQYEDLLDEAEDDEDEDWEDEEEEEDEDVEEVDDDEDEDEEDDEAEAISVEDLDDMDLAELKELAEEWDVSIKPDKGKKKLTSAQMRKRLAALFEEDEEDDEAEEADTPSVEDLEGMKLSELKEVAEEYEVSLPRVPKGKKLTAPKVRKVLIEALHGEDEDDEEEPF